MMRIPDIAFDLDGTLIDIMSVFDNLVYEIHGVKIDESKRNRFDLSCCIDIRKDQIWTVIRLAMDKHEKIKFYPGAQNFLKFVFAMTLKPIKIITNRSIDKVSQTYALVDRLCKKIPYELIINHKSYPKSMFLNGYEYMLEDRRKNVIELADNNIKTFLFSRSYNVLPDNSSPLITVVDSFTDIHKYLMKDSLGTQNAKED